MADLLGATNPVPGYDSASQNRTVPAAAQNQDPRVQNVPDPTRVSRADGRTERQGADNHLAANNLRYDSNLQTFLQALRDAPDLASVLAKSVVWLRGVVSAPGLSAGTAEEIAGLLQMLQMDQGAFAQFFFNQMQAGNRFSGPLFSLLRQAYQGMSSDNLREAILNFAKRYSDFSSTGHIGESMLSLLRQMSDYLPRSWRGQLAQMTAQLENGLQAGARADNLKLLQGQILPYLSSYVERTHDLGKVRTLIGLLTLWGMDASGRAARTRRRSGFWEELTGAAGMLAVLAMGMGSAQLLKTDYSWRGVLLIGILRLLRRDRLLLVIYAPCAFLFSEFLELLVLGAGLSDSLETVLSHMTVFLSFFLIRSYNGRRKRRGHPYFFYLFYPLHLLVLYVCRLLLFALYG